MNPSILISICFLLASPAIVFAQTPTVERQIKGKPDTNINAGIFATSATIAPLDLTGSEAGCSSGPRQGNRKTGAVARHQCLGLELPAFVAIYRSAQDFIGQDIFSLK